MGASQETRNLSTTILNTATKSAIVPLGGFALTGIITPAALTGTTLSFEVSVDGVTFFPLYDLTNTAVGVTLGASRAYTLDPAVFANWNFVKLVSGATEVADRIFTLTARPFQ